VGGPRLCGHPVRFDGGGGAGRRHVSIRAAGRRTPRRGRRVHRHPGAARGWQLVRPTASDGDQLYGRHGRGTDRARHRAAVTGRHSCAQPRAAPGGGADEPGARGARNRPPSRLREGVRTAPRRVRRGGSGPPDGDARRLGHLRRVWGEGGATNTLRWAAPDAVGIPVCAVDGRGRPLGEWWRW